MEHQHNTVVHKPDYRLEYMKFVLVMVCIVITSFMHASWQQASSWMQYMQSFMGFFFIVFGSLKLTDLKLFAVGFAMYDVVAQRSRAYAYAYPFMQVLFGISYLLWTDSQLLHVAVAGISFVSAYGVYRHISSGKSLHCLCLGNVIKLPLSNLSLAEDLGMGVMAIAMMLMLS